MNELKIQAIVLEAKDAREADKRLALFSCELGLIWATIKGVKKPKAKLAGVSQPFCFAEFLLNKKGDFYTVINASVIENFFNVTADFDKYIVGTAMLEFCKKTVKENDPSLNLFVLLLKALKQLEYAGSNPMAVLIKFLLEALAGIGYRITTNKCACCSSEGLLDYGAGYSYDHGGLMCKKCAAVVDSMQLTAQEHAIFKNISNTDIADISRLKFSGRDGLVGVISILAKQFRLYTGEELETIKEYI